jgi:hypothetical protein
MGTTTFSSSLLLPLMLLWEVAMVVASMTSAAESARALAGSAFGLTGSASWAVGCSFGGSVCRGATRRRRPDSWRRDSCHHTCLHSLKHHFHILLDRPMKNHIIPC